MGIHVGRRQRKSLAAHHGARLSAQEYLSLRSDPRAGRPMLASAAPSLDQGKIAARSDGPGQDSLTGGLEPQVGRELQSIRINGGLVHQLVGL